MSTLISPLAIAPMIDWTHTHFRVFMRLIAPKALLYTDMQAAEAIMYHPERALIFNPMENPLALQVGGSDPKKLAHCAQQAERHAFQEINLNLGCPSHKVRAGGFGACLMQNVEQVKACIQAMKENTQLPVTAKTRIGIDHHDSYEFFADFIQELIAVGCDKVIVHARKAWLKGLSPKQNRTVPPINYDFVYRIKKTLPPKIPVVINGEIKSIEEIKLHMNHVDGVMLGRLACNHPYALVKIHKSLYPDTPILDRYEILQMYFTYAETVLQEGISLARILKPLLNLANGLPIAKQWKLLVMQAQYQKNLNLLLQDTTITDYFKTSILGCIKNHESLT